VEAIGDSTDRDGGEEELLTGEEYRGGGEIRMVGRKNRRRGNGSMGVAI
jgi:hypothetical protein